MFGYGKNKCSDGSGGFCRQGVGDQKEEEERGKMGLRDSHGRKLKSLEKK